MWDERYNVDNYIYGTEPNGFLAQYYRRLPKGNILCLAEGEGRNAVFLAGKGYEVTAVDASRVGLDKAKKLADSAGVSIRCVHADLADFDLGVNQWHGIVSIFCHLPPDIRQRVHRQIPAALKPNGVLLLEAYTAAQLDYDTGGPPEEKLTLSQAIIEKELSGLQFEVLAETEREIIEGAGHTGMGAVVQAIGVKEDGR